MRSKYQSVKDELYEMKKDRNGLKEEISKLKMQVKMQQMVTQKSMVTQLSNMSKGSQNVQNAPEA